MTTSNRTGGGVVEAVSVGGVRSIRWHGRTVTTGIWKEPVTGRVAVRGVNAAGDDQADRRVHGGPDKALYAYARSDYDWWAATLGRPMAGGTFGDNLTILGIDLSAAVVGERWAVGSALLEVSEPRVPCYKLGIRMEDPAFPRRFSAALRPGTYLRIVRPGDIGAGDEVRLVATPDHGISVGLVNRAYHLDHSLAVALLPAPQLSDGWRHWAQAAVAHQEG